MYKHWFTYNSLINFVFRNNFLIIHISLNLKRRKRPAPLVFSCFLSVTFLFMEFADILSNKDLYKLPVELLFVLHFLKQVPDAVQNVDLRVRCSTKPFPQKWQEEFNQWQASWLVSHKLADSENFKHERIQSKFLLNTWVQVWLIFRSWYFISCIWINGDWKS